MREELCVGKSLSVLVFRQATVAGDHHAAFRETLQLQWRVARSHSLTTQALTTDMGI
jgi:hypothetical protein